MDGVPQSARSKAFRVLVGVLMSAPELRHVRTWKTWAGTPGDDDPPASGSLPWVRLTPTALPAEVVAVAPRPPLYRRVYRSPFKVQVEIAVAGSRVDDLVDLWERVEAAVCPQETTRRAETEGRLAAAGIRDVRVQQPAWPASAGELAAEGSMGDGVLVVEMFLEI